MVFKGSGEYQLRTFCRFHPWAGKRRKVAASCPANAWLGLLSCRDDASVRKAEEGGDVGRKSENESLNSQLGRFTADLLLLQAPGRRGVWLRAGSGPGGRKMRTGATCQGAGQRSTMVPVTQVWLWTQGRRHGRGDLGLLSFHRPGEVTQLSPLANLGTVNPQNFSELLLGVSIPSWFGSIQLLSK